MERERKSGIKCTECTVDELIMCKLIEVFAFYVVCAIYLLLQYVVGQRNATEATSAIWASPAMSAMPPLWLPARYSPQVFWIRFSFFCYSCWCRTSTLPAKHDVSCCICKKPGCKCVRVWPQVVESVVNDDFVGTCWHKEGCGDLHIVGTCEAFRGRVES